MPSCGQVQVADIGFLGCQTKGKEGGPKRVDGVKVFLGGAIGHEAELGNEIAEVRCEDLLPYTQALLVEQFGASLKDTIDAEGEAAIKRWTNFPFNSGGTPEVFPANGNGDYVKV